LQRTALSPKLHGGLDIGADAVQQENGMLGDAWDKCDAHSDR
jgi:hypothetical protein